jgi:hypothetical protein
MAFMDRLRRVVNAFTSQTPLQNLGYGGSGNSNRSVRFTYNDRSILSSVYTRISMDVAGVVIKHVELDEKRRYKKDADSALNDCLTIQPNLDQGPRAFRQDICMTLFDKASAAIVPVLSERDELGVRLEDVSDMRVGDITQYYPQHIRVNVWNEARGQREEITLEKRLTAIVENPLSPVMNEPNSTMQRLIRKLRLLDTVDEATSSGKIDVIIQLPYVVKSETRKQQAEQRISAIETQLRGSTYGIAYVDATEKITQLNRPAENQLLEQVQYLVGMLYGELGITPEVMNGTADEATMINYYARTVYPIVDAIVEAKRRAFLGRDRIKSGEDIRYFRDPFKFATLAQFADSADKFRRNEIATSNELRDVIGLAPNDEPQADQLSNPNMPQPIEISTSNRRSGVQEPERNSQNGS